MRDRWAIKNCWKVWPVMAGLMLGLGASSAWADHHEEAAGNHDQAKHGTASDKPDAYTVEDSRDKTLTNAKKPVRKLDHKLKHKGDKPVDAATSTNADTSGVNTGKSPNQGNTESSR